MLKEVTNAFESWMNLVNNLSQKKKNKGENVVNVTSTFYKTLNLYFLRKLKWLGLGSQHQM